MSSAFPWLYRYREDGPLRRDKVVLRPFVRISVIGETASPPGVALVDSGSEHTLVVSGIAEAAGIDNSTATDEIQVAIGGETVPVQLTAARLRLHAPDGDDEDYVEWDTELGLVPEWRPTWPVLLGQVGFLDRFTVTMSRQSQILVIEEWDTLDLRFGVVPATSD